MPCHHVQHAQNVGPNLFACNENHAYIMPRVTACAVMSCMHHTVHACRQASHPYVNMACQKLPCVTAHAVTSYAQHTAHAHRQASTVCICGAPEIAYGCAIHAS